MSACALLSVALAASLACQLAIAQAPGTGAAGPEFARAFERQYEQSRPLAPDMVVEEMRLRVESVASRGSRVGAASNDRRVRGFESALLLGLQDTNCPAGRAGSTPQRPSAGVVDSVQRAAEGQKLQLQGGDMASFAALAQRLIDTQGARLCGLRSMDEVR